MRAVKPMHSLLCLASLCRELRSTFSWFADDVTSPTADAFRCSSSGAAAPIVIDVSHNAFILLPDCLISPSRITASLSCLRRGLLSDFVSGSDEGRKTALLGTVSLASDCWHAYLGVLCC